MIKKDCVEERMRNRMKENIEEIRKETNIEPKYEVNSKTIAEYIERETCPMGFWNFKE